MLWKCNSPPLLSVSVIHHKSQIISAQADHLWAKTTIALQHNLVIFCLFQYWVHVSFSSTLVLCVVLLGNSFFHSKWQKIWKALKTWSLCGWIGDWLGWTNSVWWDYNEHDNLMKTLNEWLNQTALLWVGSEFLQKYCSWLTAEWCVCVFCSGVCWTRTAIQNSSSLSPDTQAIGGEDLSCESLPAWRPDSEDYLQIIPCWEAPDMDSISPVFCPWGEA